MRILLTNDDGLHAPGIAAMFDALVGADEQFSGPLLDHSAGAVSRAPRSVVLPVAPLTVQSATSHGVTFHQPLLARQQRVNDRMLGIAVDGRPADCVKVAIAEVWPERFGAGSRPELLISGMNAGANVGINVIYSGTVAAALEGAFLGIPSIAVSMMLGRGEPRFDVAARHARLAIERLIAGGLPERHACLSINVPVTEGDVPMRDMAVCPMNTHGLNDQYDRRVNPAGEVYYWASGSGLDFRTTDDGSDVQELLRNRITVTPLQYDLTRHSTLDHWKTRLGAHRP